LGLNEFLSKDSFNGPIFKCSGPNTEFGTQLWEQVLQRRSPGHKVPVLLSTLELFPFTSFFFFNWAVIGHF